jgi:hypothetical protein
LLGRELLARQRLLPTVHSRQLGLRQLLAKRTVRLRLGDLLALEPLAKRPLELALTARKLPLEPLLFRLEGLGPRLQLLAERPLKGGLTPRELALESRLLRLLPKLRGLQRGPRRNIPLLLGLLRRDLTRLEPFPKRPLERGFRAREATLGLGLGGLKRLRSGLEALPQGPLQRTLTRLRGNLFGLQGLPSGDVPLLLGLLGGNLSSLQALTERALKGRLPTRELPLGFRLRRLEGLPLRHQPLAEVTLRLRFAAREGPLETCLLGLKPPLGLRLRGLLGQLPRGQRLLGADLPGELTQPQGLPEGQLALGLRPLLETGRLLLGERLPELLGALGQLLLLDPKATKTQLPLERLLDVKLPLLLAHLGGLHLLTKALRLARQPRLIGREVLSLSRLGQLLGQPRRGETVLHLGLRGLLEQLGVKAGQRPRLLTREVAHPAAANRGGR